MAITAADGVGLLLATGLPVQVRGFADLEVADRHARLVVRQTPPSPSMVEFRDEEVLVYVVPHLTRSLSEIAESDPRIAVVGIRDHTVIWGGRRLPAGSADDAPAPLPRRIPWARFALLRALARTRRPRTQSELAAETGATQASVSKNLRSLDIALLRSSDGWALRDLDAAATSFLAEYPGPKGIVQHWYSPRPVVDQADRALRADPRALLSGDAGADRIAPWRTPRAAVVYAPTGLSLAGAGFAESRRDAATLTVVVPADPTIWRVAEAYAAGSPPRVVDPLLCAYDVQRIGGSDADEAGTRLIGSLESHWVRDD